MKHSPLVPFLGSRLLISKTAAGTAAILGGIATSGTFVLADLDWLNRSKGKLALTKRNRTKAVRRRVRLLVFRGVVEHQCFRHLGDSTNA